MTHRDPRPDGGRAARLGPRPGLSASLALAAVLGAGATLSACGQGTTTAATAATAAPSQPSATAADGAVVTATSAHPALAVQGATVDVRLAGGHVVATVVGPKVPPFVAPPPPSVTATFTVSLARSAGSVPVRLADFSIAAQDGRLVHPLLVTGDAAPPTRTSPGADLTFRLTAVLPTGEGQLQWAPSSTPVARWDFVVEND